MKRAPQPELMDDPGLDPAEHERALDGLGRLNAVSASTAPLWPGIVAAARHVGQRPIHVLDLACGGGHVAVALARRAQRAGLSLDVLGADISPVALDYAGRLAAHSGVCVGFSRLDALHDPLPPGFDVILCSLFFHHLTNDAATELLRKMAAATRRLVLVSDLRRTRLGQVFAWVGCRALSGSRIVRVDGGRSVRAAFTPDEARRLADAAGLAGARVTTRWPQRWVMSWVSASARL